MASAGRGNGLEIRDHLRRAVGPTRVHSRRRGCTSISAGKRTKSETPGKDQVAMDITPGLNPLAKIGFMEVMIGAQRQFVLFTGPGNSPVVAMQDDGSAKADSAVEPAGAVEGNKQ